MKKVVIEWKHLQVEENTCDRCATTGENILRAIEWWNVKNPKSEHLLSMEEVFLTAKQLDSSNAILFNGQPFENYLPKIKIVKNDCPSCSSLIGNSACCRAVQHECGTVQDEVSAEIIFQALENFLRTLG